MRSTPEKNGSLLGNPQEDFLVAPQQGHIRSVLSEFAHAVSAAQDAPFSFPVSESTLSSKLSSSPSSSQGLQEQRSQADISLPPGFSQYHVGSDRARPWGLCIAFRAYLQDSVITNPTRLVRKFL